jgi:large conductance mechanosensitive channel
VDGFKQFILRGNVVDLAVGVVIGAAFGTVVQALVKDLITPLLGAVGGVPDFSELVFTVNGSRFLIGDFINALLLMERMKGETPVGPATRECPRCLSKIPRAARGCAFCTADVEPLSADGATRIEPAGRAPDRTRRLDESAEDELKDALKSTRDELKGAARPAGGGADRQPTGPEVS